LAQAILALGPALRPSARESPSMEPAPSTNLFISDLANSLTADQITEEKLWEVFQDYGTLVSCKPLPPGAALLNFATQEESTWVRENLDGNIPQGLTAPIAVKYANNSTGGAKGTWGKAAAGQAQGAVAASSPYNGKGAVAADKGAGKGKGKVTSCSIEVLKDGLIKAGAMPGHKWSTDGHALFLGGLPRDTTDIDLYHIFSAFGAIPAKGVRAMIGPDGVGTGVGFVNFLDPAACQLAIATLNGAVMPDGCILEVKMKASTKGKGKDKGMNNSWCMNQGGMGGMGGMGGAGAGAGAASGPTFEEVPEDKDVNEVD